MSRDTLIRKEGNSSDLNNVFMACLGTFILWLGWYGFNPGSELVLNEEVFYTAVTTTVAAAIRCL